MGSWDEAEGAGALAATPFLWRDVKAEGWQAACSLWGEADPAEEKEIVHSYMQIEEKKMGLNNRADILHNSGCSDKIWLAFP